MKYSPNLHGKWDRECQRLWSKSLMQICTENPKDRKCNICGKGWESHQDIWCDRSLVSISDVTSFRNCYDINWGIPIHNDADLYEEMEDMFDEDEEDSEE